MRLFLIPLMLVACGGNRADDTAGGGGGGGGDDTPGSDAECANDDDCGTGEICDGDTCTPGDRNDSPDEADTLFWSDPVDGRIEPAGDEDWYAVTSDGGEFLVAHTEDAEDEDILDTVVSVYDESGHVLAWEDEHPGGNIGSGYDSVVYAYLADPGTYYVKVEDVGHFEGGTGLGGGDADYMLQVDSYDAPDETDSLADAAGDYGEASANVWYSALAVMEEPDDADYFTFDVPDYGMPLAIVTAQHTDGSEATPRVRLYNGDGDLVLSFVDPDASDAYAILPATRNTRYVLAIDDADGGGSPDAWAAGFFILREADRAYPDEVEPNDDTSVATVLDMTDNEPDAGQWFEGYSQGWLETADDADVFEASNPFDDAYVSVVAIAPSWGGLLTPHVEVVDSLGQVVASGDGVVGEDTYVLNAGPVATGEYFVRVTAQPDTGAEGGEGYYYLALVHFTSFTFDE